MPDVGFGQRGEVLECTTALIAHDVCLRGTAERLLHQLTEVLQPGQPTGFRGVAQTLQALGASGRLVAAPGGRDCLQCRDDFLDRLAALAWNSAGARIEIKHI
jgi:hypothetical protein